MHKNGDYHIQICHLGRYILSDIRLGHMFYIGLYMYRENMKKCSCLKPQGLEP